MSTVRELRTAKGWSQQELANRAGVAIQTVVRLEKGTPVRTLIRNAVCAALGSEDVDIKIVSGVRNANK